MVLISRLPVFPTRIFIQRASLLCFPASLTAAFAAGDPSGFRTNWWTLTFDADAQIVLDVFDYGKQLFADLVTTNGTQWSLDIQPIDQKFIQATQAGNNPSGLSGDNLFRM